jgi:hypothetical protein
MITTKTPRHQERLEARKQMIDGSPISICRGVLVVDLLGPEIPIPLKAGADLYCDAGLTQEGNAGEFGVSTFAP